jgi:putative tryptophan/tyrosine transport system substrate-binding protein
MEQGAKGKEQKNEERKDMQKKITILALTAMLFALYVSAEAQQVGKVYRVGYLSGGFARSTFNIDAIRRELRELGYVEGKNISFEARYAEDKSERSPALADELVRLKVDVIIAGGSNDTRAAKKAIQTIPIVFTDAVSDPVARGLVEAWRGPEETSRDFTPWPMF